MGQSTLYPLLYNLEAKKLVQAKWEITDSRRKRRYYSITGKGEEELASQKAQLQGLAKGLDLLFGGVLKVAL
jgi:PadR family transcriptional regulator PadR